MLKSVLNSLMKILLQVEELFATDDTYLMPIV